MSFIVYLTINTVNRFIYVGVHECDPSTFDGYLGCGVYARESLSENKEIDIKGTPFQRAIKKYGSDKFERITLGEFETPEEAYKQEAAIVTTEFIKRTDVYNAKIGGTTKKIIQYTSDGKFLKVWDSILEAYQHFNKKSGNRILKCLSGETETWLGFQWKRHEDDYPTIIPPADILKIPICQYGEDGLLIKIWESKMIAARTLGCSHSGLRHATISRKSYFGSQWRYFINEIPDFIGNYINPDIVLQLNKETGEIVKEWDQLVDALRSGLSVDRNMTPRTAKAAKYNWTYKVHYKHLDCDIVQNREITNK